MGLFDFLKRGGGGAMGEAAIGRHAERVLDKRGMSPDRFPSIEYLCRLGTEDAWRAVLPRYNFTVDPSITDREEKQYIFDQLKDSPETALEPVKEFVRKTSAVNWPLKMLRAIQEPEDFVETLLEVLKGEDTSYQKNPERKIQVIIALEDEVDARVPPAVLPFLEDVSEDTRFHAVRTLLAQGDASAVEPLWALFVRDDSMRIRTTIADGMAERSWAAPEGDREKVAQLLLRVPNGPYTLSPELQVQRPPRR
ncbi:MAG: HEAT repeat domain-containing protein [Deltaproteobacteria bacterium]|nr:HEAT repeat domain-containing protein [Deltaproteobacteria bacterium]